MDLYLLRHGIAEDHAPSHRDEDRQLTATGKERLVATLRHAADCGMEVERIVSSPYIRARQTAELASRQWPGAGEIVFADALVPHSRPEVLWDEVKLHRDVGSLLLVAHEPLLSACAGFLLGCVELQTDFRKGAIMRLQVHSTNMRPHGILRWMLTAKLAGA
jgi:phosphohistidine phosphatase